MIELNTIAKPRPKEVEKKEFNIKLKLGDKLLVPIQIGRKYIRADGEIVTILFKSEDPLYIYNGNGYWYDEEGRFPTGTLNQPMYLGTRALIRPVEYTKDELGILHLQHGYALEYKHKQAADKWAVYPLFNPEHREDYWNEFKDKYEFRLKEEV